MSPKRHPGGPMRAVGRQLFGQHGYGIAGYELFARIVGLLLSLAVSLIILLALFHLFRALVTDAMATGGEFDFATFRTFFEMVLTVLIALEFNHTLAEIVAGRSGLIQARAVVLIGILVVVRKFILIEIESTPALFLIGLALAIFALGVVYWLVVDVDRRAPRRGRSSGEGSDEGSDDDSTGDRERTILG